MSIAPNKFAKSWEVRINLDERSEILHWVCRLGCSEQQLRDAIQTVGPDAAAVRRHLGR